ncbi:MAG: hypothetical protein COB04_18470 [Gammaproteobacteria bacterium]|nr:MAG: hypothetical protein COB04_18470 [Gammaproteobacteria bacterium]
MSHNKTLFIGVRIVLLLVALGLTGCISKKDLIIAKGFTAKHLCSFVFNSALDETYIKDTLIKPKVWPMGAFLDIDIDRNNKTVSVRDKVSSNPLLSFLFPPEDRLRQATYREAMGCTLLIDTTREALLSISITPLAPPILSDQPWPYGNAGLYKQPIEGLDTDKLALAVSDAFKELDDGKRHTTALLVAHKGKLIAEQYAHGLKQDTPILGWSMTKTLTATITGILQDQGKIIADTPAPIAAWKNTDKTAITIQHLLKMSSGLEFNEDYGDSSDVSTMLFTTPHPADFAAQRPLIATPGTRFGYSTGSSYLLSKIIQDAVGGPQAAYDFYQTHLFHKTHITSAIVEFDATNHIDGGSFAWLSPRDWARMGQLYLNKGQWNGDQVISAERIDEIITPGFSRFYGSQIWLNTDGHKWPQLPHDLYYFSGHQGQRIIVVPSKQLVVVRLGVTDDYGLIQEESFMNDIIEALPQ